MSVIRSSSSIGLFALLLSVIVLSLFAGLIAADRALSRSDRESAHLDARVSAMAVEREIRSRADPLTELLDPLLRPPSPGAREIRAPTVVPRGFDAIWIADTSGRVAWRSHPPIDSVAGTSTGAPIPDSLVSAIARTAQSLEGLAVRVAASPSGSRAPLLLVVPLRHQGQKLGASVGLLAASELDAAFATPSASRRSVELRSESQVIASRPASGTDEPFIVDSALVDLDGDPLRVHSGYAQSGRVLRTALWLFGIVGLSALLGGLYRERRQTLQLGARTAELERLYQEVARSNRMKSEFLANVSHELRTPLNAIVGFVEMLRESVYGELTPRQALPVDRIAASATHLRHLVDRLLDIAKVAAGRLEVHTEPLVLRPFVLNVASEMESLVSERGLTLSIGVAPTLPRILTDQTHLRQILINLIGNAVKYTPSGTIQVRARVIGNGASAEAVEHALGAPPDSQRSWVALQVADSGIGIAPSDQERIFDEFEQVNAGARTDSARRGTGLGLAISRRLSRLLGGDLTVVSEPGKGSTFTVWLPLGEAEST